jgi:two-component system C4-dicarboxylate transport sensor histidine kinase DctB
MARYSREGYARAPQPYDVYASVRDVLALLLPSAGFDVKVTLELHGEGVIECVPEEFNQVLTNLIENALQAVPCDGSAELTVLGQNRGKELMLTIADNGVGIAEDDQLRIFTPFFTTKDAGRGMGLGLAITRRVVSSLGGSIQVQSRSGQGSRFVVRVPRPLTAGRGVALVARARAEAAS